jgi:hypothetical protein
MDFLTNQVNTDTRHQAENKDNIHWYQIHVLSLFQCCLELFLEFIFSFIIILLAYCTTLSNFYFIISINIETSEKSPIIVNFFLNLKHYFLGLGKTTPKF